MVLNFRAISADLLSRLAIKAAFAWGSRKALKAPRTKTSSLVRNREVITH